ncbi:MAG: hypothetical protein ACE37L_12060 [Allomuricauda sp.]|jgi:hypothetical protein|uniref:hypothetical protein n=1 Tax=Flavobacteriaceae TaxID=49546 RepID=UPI0015CC6AB4|nr:MULTISPECIES: hypothetical protein [unclassified Allomuricauda]MBO6532424.1 hypothetical protein [Allomuricauda sp.]MBO6587913.1 hypothetical protein [Allomuricauda sp.]MBO6617538.1 hypothetical protein [Allomuricauda sp.]MBO6643451.1 hypothetical protein [Allomuricauda sp.]MBO6745873.1 hypothetical protein [Allomuricauda sp.]
MENQIKKLVEVDKSLVVKLKVLSAFENLSVKALMEKAIVEYVKKKELERFDQLSEAEKEDLGLLLLMQQADKEDFVSEDDVFKLLDE